MLKRNSATVLTVALVGVLSTLSVAACGAVGHFGMHRHAVRARPANLDTSLERLSDKGLYQVRIECLETPIRPHRIHSWAVTVEHDGKPVEGATILVGGGMPEHGHGYPTKPRVEAADAGAYAIRGMKFSMRGWWELKLNIQSPAGADQVTFNMVV